MKPFEWTGIELKILDQRLLPGEVAYIACRTSGEVAQAIAGMAVRGAPAIGVAAAYGVVLAAAESGSYGEFLGKASALRGARPTAVNLMWAVERMLRLLPDNVSSTQQMPGDVLRRLEAEARSIEAEDLASCMRIGAFGNALISDGDGILTHCNAGALATAGYGTALGIIRAAREAGKRIRVYACETRPYLQGARLTAAELHADGIPVTLLCDNMAAWLMKSGKVHKIVVGADRIAANGDTANKIGTYQLALCAKAHGIPFYVAAPFSTVDLSLPDGGGIPIEHRDENEVLYAMGIRTAPQGVSAYNPAFDVTPAALIGAVVTDRGVAFQPLAENLGLLCKPG
jgi:methylthioribose-1-phosphate isomerase